ncbi:putative RNA polymerase II transcriptional coactivator [Cercospora beticola]|uniref:Putative RNA polymerase II transcriptional coactivator n=1 Tax=Cercospora beticola TaxID=122368 RepID=A0A2G5HUR5_CERBT|nr:putative RNA polymerase II transcriptional coactivator [Cercospora beticola]PIA96284.1 putative RNA polymerase II transcriptional coactivator [Cercospora beticola]WPB07581.1 hypothetical protein RHO25_012242 [Cercospora beticola]CAK1367582.1 unnamed protein product [Cercospora beticola]
MSGIYHSYFDTVSTTRKSPTKRSNSAKKQQEPPKKLSKAFTRQLEKTLSTTQSTKKRKGGVKKQTSTKRKRAPTTAKMPKRPAAEETYDSDGGFVEDAEPKSKKSKHSANSTSKTSSKKKNVAGSAPATMEKDKDGGVYWSIANKRRVQLTEFKGTLMVGIREFYEKDGEMLPGKKGISMTLEQFDAVLGVLPELEREVRKRGGKVRRVSVEGEGGEKEEGGEEEEEKEKEAEEEEEAEELPKKTKNKLEKFKHKAKNHEATSDEEED